MKFHEKLRSILNDNKDDINLIQISIISSITTLMYSEYINNFRRVIVPTDKVFIPEVKLVSETLSMESEFSSILSDRLIDGITSNELFQRFNSLPNLSLFNDNIEELKSIFDLYIMNNASKYIVSQIRKMFNLDDESNRLFIESSDLDLFKRKTPNDNMIQYLIDHTVLQLLTLSPGIERTLYAPESNSDIPMSSAMDNILLIAINNAPSVMAFNRQIFENSEIMNLLSFVTSTNVIEATEFNSNKNEDEIIGYDITTNPFNKCTIIKLLDMEEIN